MLFHSYTYCETLRKGTATSRYTDQNRFLLKMNSGRNHEQEFGPENLKTVKKYSTKLEFFLICLVLRLPRRVVLGSELSKTGSELSKTAQIKKTIAFWLRMSWCFVLTRTSLENSREKKGFARFLQRRTLQNSTSDSELCQRLQISRKICGDFNWNFDNFSKVSGFQNQTPIWKTVILTDFFHFSLFWTEKWKNVHSVFANPRDGLKKGQTD